MIPLGKAANHLETQSVPSVVDISLSPFMYHLFPEMTSPAFLESNENILEILALVLESPFYIWRLDQIGIFEER